VFVDELVEQLVPPPVDPFGLGADELPQQLQLRQPREVVLEVEASQEGDVDLAELAEEPVPASLPVRLAEHRAAHDVVSVAAQEPRHVHHRAWSRRRRVTDPGEDDAHLFQAAMAEGVHLLGAEHVRGEELPGLPPPLAVRREGDVRQAVEDDVGDGGPRPGREHVVVRAQDGLGGARRRHHQRGCGAEVEQQEAVAAVPGGG
jgi:hypothetical protein